MSKDILVATSKFPLLTKYQMTSITTISQHSFYRFKWYSLLVSCQFPFPLQPFPQYAPFLPRFTKKLPVALSVFFFPVTTKSARDTPPVKFCHRHFWLFMGILSKIVTGKLKNFTVIFSKKVTGKLEISRSIRKKVVTGNLQFVTCTFVLRTQNFCDLQL